MAKSKLGFWDRWRSSIDKAPVLTFRVDVTLRDHHIANLMGRAIALVNEDDSLAFCSGLDFRGWIPFDEYLPEWTPEKIEKLIRSDAAEYGMAAANSSEDIENGVVIACLILAIVIPRFAAGAIAHGVSLCHAANAEVYEFFESECRKRGLWPEAKGLD